MSDTAKVFGTTYTGVTALKVSDGSSGTLTYIRPTGTKSITSNGTGIDVSEYAAVDVSVSGGGGSANLQAKTNIDPTESSQTIEADTGYDGLSSVQINAISSSYVGSGVTTKAAATYNTSTSDQTIAASQYLSGAQTIKAVAVDGLSASNVKYGATVKVGDSNDDDRIAGIIGTFSGSSTVSSGQTAATASKIVSGYSAFVDGVEVEGSIASKINLTASTAAGAHTVTAEAGYYASDARRVYPTIQTKTWYPTTSSQTFPPSDGNMYMINGTQTIAAVATSNLTAANIKAGVTVKVGDSADDDRIAGVTGTFTSDGTAAAGDIVSGKSAYVNGSKINGSLTFSTITVSSSNPTGGSNGDIWIKTS